ncbi:hypothetical protein O181_062854 [Austropuccinia psidii MF-1]|uniref:Reverse transcriptase Ty1/copia-type domain-containing protein n=1 Tax=Austropuccinia psidii MF-1 TaxID=1389203 RepID=A0A9Q3EKY4_9BASI|nr:hypothetical protein [Austropuccinia psidii MF-1]
MDVPKQNVLKLRKALYGTKQASWCWWLHLKETLQRISFTNNKEDPSTYMSNQGNAQAILWVHVDDGALTASLDTLLDWMTGQLDEHLKIKWDANMNGLASEPDISYAVNYLAHFSLKTDQSHWDALEHLISYMHGTRNMGILIQKSNSSSKIKCFVDANWGGEGNRSTHGYIILHGLNPIGWQLRRQTTIASLTAQAEYMALLFAAKEVLWLYNLFIDILRNPIPILLSDNRTAVRILTDTMNKKQTRHLIREFNTINKFIAVQKPKLEWVSTNEQLADILTKSLGTIKNSLFVLRLNYL